MAWIAHEQLTCLSGELFAFGWKCHRGRVEFGLGRLGGLDKPVFGAIGINLDGRPDVLSIWGGDCGEEVRHGMTMPTELRNCSIANVMIVCRDGLVSS
ncbi:hypothetical protein Afil01_44020 [Actinorhabdospora filicis]|uniref:Uncharacterized protein n=1 Tax=Actinorhabdospora filicis TaxID=1785913 RepID=A0A9W6WCB2_9ACTN|nr:hypothetical protein Afil01_44020 [Actinorhabdospora filicis]